MKELKIGNLPELDYSGTEALNTICTNLLFSGRDEKKVAVTSGDSGNGKTFMSMHIAQNLAQRGKRICLVDADLRRSSMIRNYRLQTEGEWTGLAHYLAGYNSLSDVVYSTNIEGLWIVPIGREIVNPVQLLEVGIFGEFLDQLSREFDMVIVDAPPVGLVIDAAIIAQSCDGCMIVIEYNKSRRRELNEAIRQIRQSGCPILGCVINKVSLDSFGAKHYYNRGYYAHYYSKYYTSDGKKKKNSAKRSESGKRS